MNRPVVESLELRELLSAELLAAGAVAYFDFNGDGVRDAILVNTGSSALEYEYSGGTGLDSVKLTADGGKFTTNMWVSLVSDTSDTDDYTMGATQIGVNVKYCRTTYAAITGDTNVVAGAVTQLELGKGDLLSVTTTEGDIGKVYVRSGDLTDATAAGSICSLIIEGDVLGMVSAGATINLISANKLSGAYISCTNGALNTLAVDSIEQATVIDVASMGTLSACSVTGMSQITVYGGVCKIQIGTISDATITTGGSVGSILADLIAGSENGTTITVGGHVNKLCVQTMTAGTNGTLYLSIGDGVDCFLVGQLDGGQATDGGFSGAFISINGNVGKLQAGVMSGGIATGDGSYSMLDFTVGSCTDDDGNVQAGDVTYLAVSQMIGGTSIDGGDAMLNFTIANDLTKAVIGQIIGNGRAHQMIADPSVYLTVGNDIVKMLVGSITAGFATGDYSYASVFITAGRDIAYLSAGSIDAGTASGTGSTTEVYITAGRDIGVISATTFSGGVATGDGAMAELYVEAGRNINLICASLISGTQARVAIQDPTVQFIAGGDIGMVLASRITGGTVTSDGVSEAKASVIIQANGTYVDDDGVQSAGDIGMIIVGTIDGGSANGADALSYVRIRAAHDINTVYVGTISGGSSSNGGFAYVSIVAEHDIVNFCAGTITGATTLNGRVCGDPAVVIQAYNDIKNMSVNTIMSGLNGTVSILAGLDEFGNISGELDADGNLIAGSIESLVIGLINSTGGEVNIAAGGDIEYLSVRTIISGDGEVNIVAGDDITASIGSIKSWSLADETGVEFSAGGEVTDVRNSIKAEYTSENLGDTVEFPETVELAV